MQNAHRIATRYRPYTTSYAAALAYRLKAAWQQLSVVRSFAAQRSSDCPHCHDRRRDRQPRRYPLLRIELRRRVSGATNSGISRNASGPP
jgi:hypothetical protein